MSQIPFCAPLRSLGWGDASFPNFRGQERPSDAQEELQDFQPLIQVQCSNALGYLLCAIYAPYCDPDYPQLRLKPCKELCQHVRSTCEDNTRTFEYKWPKHLDCDNSTMYPARNSGIVNFCPDNIAELQFPTSS